MNNIRGTIKSNNMSIANAKTARLALIYKYIIYEYFTQTVSIADNIL